VYRLPERRGPGLSRTDSARECCEQHGDSREIAQIEASTDTPRRGGERDRRDSSGTHRGREEGPGAFGALNLLSSSPHAFDDDAVSIGASLATHAAIAVIAAQREEQFRDALESRDTIGQAKGMLMEKLSVDADQAFRLLRKLSQQRNTPLYEIARTLTADVTPPPQRRRADRAG